MLSWQIDTFTKYQTGLESVKCNSKTKVSGFIAVAKKVTFPDLLRGILGIICNFSFLPNSTLETVIYSNFNEKKKLWQGDNWTLALLSSPQRNTSYNSIFLPIKDFLTIFSFSFSHVYKEEDRHKEKHFTEESFDPGSSTDLGEPPWQWNTERKQVWEWAMHTLPSTVATKLRHNS